MKKNIPKEKRIFDIIAAAMILFSINGYKATSMEAIAVQAGLSKGGLYHYFSSKDEILIAANQAMLEPIRDFMLVAVDNRDVYQGLKKFFVKYLTHWSKHSRELVFSFLSFSKILEDAKLWKYMFDYLNEMVDFYERLLIRGIEENIFLEHNTRSRALAMVAALDGITLYLAMGNESPLAVATKFRIVFLDEILK